ncbi:alpha/beta fold hydrolase [Pseudoxanthomonas suwonensis]|uniref:alpha/beta fold hydrolase n=1 Tax=Pseudoxanthomonas suwonensis TaxID=314722 RepID=UPI00138EF4CE|nr:alpha/beta hydrolase [Pseudoxanthomonas suwonensis]KAF1699953.1 alpha/beta hydrolase [Pseudoxanthomonas suwonensis]
MTPAEATLPVAWGQLAALRVERPGAPRVIALHGWLDNAASFLPLLTHLPPLDLALLDFPGHGRSTHLPPGAEYLMPTYVHAVLDAADALGWERFALLGHSMGAAVAAMVAVAQPQRVARLGLIETVGPLAEDETAAPERLRQAVGAARALRGKSLRVFPDPGVAVRARLHASPMEEAAARLLVERGIRPVEGGHVWSSDPRLTLPGAQRMTEGQVQALLRALECPVHAVLARKAQPYFPEDVRAARLAVLPRAEVTVLDGGHHLHMDRPAEVAAALGPFLAVAG